MFGVAISTAAQRAAMHSNLRSQEPSSSNSGVISEGRDKTDNGFGLDHSQTLDAKMAGFRIVFISLVPLISLCFVGNFLVNDVILRDNHVTEDKISSIEGVSPFLFIYAMIWMFQICSFTSPITSVV